LSTSDS